MSEPERIYFRPDEALERAEAVRQVVDEFLAFFADQADERGDHELAARLRAKIAEREAAAGPAKPAARTRRNPRKPAAGDDGKSAQ